MVLSIDFYWTRLIDGSPAAQLGISGMACKVNGVTVRAESSILELVEIVSGMAIADASCRSHLRLVMAPSSPCTRHVLENAAGSQAAIACEA